MELSLTTSSPTTSYAVFHNFLYHLSLDKWKGFFLFKKSFYFMLEYSRLTILWYFQVDSERTQPYISLYPFSPRLPSHWGWHIILSRIPCAYIVNLRLSILNIAVCTSPSQAPYPFPSYPPPNPHQSELHSQSLWICSCCVYKFRPMVVFSIQEEGI